MKTVTIVITLICSFMICQAESMIGRIYIDHPSEIADLRAAGFRILTDELPMAVDLVIDSDDYQRLVAMGYHPEMLLPFDVFDQMDVDPEYHTYEELTEELQTLAIEYPDLCRLDSIGRATSFPRTIWCMKLSDNADTEEDEMALFYFGTHHGAEPIGCETALYMINHFLSQYGTDPQITEWMDSFEIFFVPLVNPDGHYAVISDYHHCWRKNARDINHNNVYYEFRGTGTFDDDMEGVDLNRNYDWYWATGGSTNPRDLDYIGPAAFSESELQAIRDLGYAQNFVCGLSLHSYGEIILYPWYGPPFPPDLDVIETVAQEMAHCFIADSGDTYDYDFAWGQSGQCRNWFYGVLGSLVYCVELNPTGIAICPGSELEERAQRYMEGSMYLLHRLSGPGITGHVRDGVTGEPLCANVEIVGMTSWQVEPRYTDRRYGRFTRLVNRGNYTLEVQKPGYQLQTISNIEVVDEMVELEVELQPIMCSDVASQNRHKLEEVNVLVENITGNCANLKIDLQVASDLDLQFYDILGREVAQYSMSYMEKGLHNIHLTLPSLSAGVYFYRLDTRNSHIVRKMVFIK